MRAYVRNRIGIHVGLYDKISSATERVSSPHFRTLRNPIEDLAVHRRPVLPISFNHCTVISGFVFEFAVKLRSHFRVPCTLLLYTPWGFRIKYNISSHPHTLVVLALRWMYNDVWLIVYSSLLGQGSYVFIFPRTALDLVVKTKRINTHHHSLAASHYHYLSSGLKLCVLQRIMYFCVI